MREGAVAKGGMEAKAEEKNIVLKATVQRTKNLETCLILYKDRVLKTPKRQMAETITVRTLMAVKEKPNTNPQTAPTNP